MINRPMSSHEPLMTARSQLITDHWSLMTYDRSRLSALRPKLYAFPNLDSPPTCDLMPIANWQSQLGNPFKVR